jgi:hypothetical protein
MCLLFKHYNHKAVADIKQADIEQYMQYIKEVHKVGRAKCRSVAQANRLFLNTNGGIRGDFLISKVIGFATELVLYFL